MHELGNHFLAAAEDASPSQFSLSLAVIIHAQSRRLRATAWFALRDDSKEDLSRRKVEKPLKC